MKKFILVILAVVLAFSVAACSSGDISNDEITDKAGSSDDYGGEPVSAFSGIIIEIGDNSILIEPDEESNEAKSSDRISLSLEDVEINAKVGDRVAVLYKGQIAESDPAWINDVISVDVLYDWGITLTAKNVTATGLTLVCTQKGGEVTGEIDTGEDYFLEVLTENGWEKVPTVIEEYAWNSIAYMVTLDGITVWDVDWEWLYGKLETGTYRLGKGFMDFRGPGDYDNAVFYAEFEINEDTAENSDKKITDMAGA